MLIITLLLLCVGGIIWTFVSEDIRTMRRLQFLVELDKLNNENS